MRLLDPLLLLALAAPASAQKITALDIAKANGKPTLKTLMTNELCSPKVQLALGVTSAQSGLQVLRMMEEITKYGYGMARSTYEEGDKGDSSSNLSSEFLLGPSLFPYLNDVQVAKLRKLTLKDDPLSALGTEEVAFALELTPTERKSIETLRLQYAKAQASPSRPSVIALNKALANVQAVVAKVQPADVNESNEDSIKRIDLAQKTTLDLLHAMETSVRLAAKEKDLKSPDPLKLLTEKQRRRFRELSGATSLK